MSKASAPKDTFSPDLGRTSTCQTSQMDASSDSFEHNIRGIPTHGGRYVQYNVYDNLFEVSRKYVPPIQPVGRSTYDSPSPERPAASALHLTCCCRCHCPGRRRQAVPGRPPTPPSSESETPVSGSPSALTPLSHSLLPSLPLRRPPTPPNPVASRLRPLQSPPPASTAALPPDSPVPSPHSSLQPLPPRLQVRDYRADWSLTVTQPVAGNYYPKPPAAPGGYIPISRKEFLKNLEINGEGRINAWVDSMRASSPTHIKATPSLVDHHDQSSWIVHHPSALGMFEQIIDASKGKQIVMFLDYDGTLSPIVDDPDRVFMSEAMRKTVRKLARCFPTAIVSGRCRDKVYSFVRLAELYYAGSHGMDIKGPAKGSKYKKGSHRILFQPASEFLSMIDEVSFFFSSLHG